jgi:hypothetical protein
LRDYWFEAQMVGKTRPYRYLVWCVAVKSSIAPCRLSEATHHRICAARSSIAHQRLSLFQSTEKFKIFDPNDRPKLDFRIELLSSVSFH